MSKAGEREIDVLEALAEGVARLKAAIEQAGADTVYLEGQRAFFEAAEQAIEQAGPDARPQAVLEQAAAELGIQLEDHELASGPLDDREAGVLAAWGICIGYVEGFPAGAGAVIDRVDATPGMQGDIEER